MATDAIVLLKEDHKKVQQLFKRFEGLGPNASKTKKEIGTRARQDLEWLLGQKVFLVLQVKVQKDWQRDPRALQRLGY